MARDLFAVTVIGAAMAVELTAYTVAGAATCAARTTVEVRDRARQRVQAAARDAVDTVAEAAGGVALTVGRWLVW